MEAREFEKIFWVLHPQLNRHARYLLDPASAEDVVAEAFTTLWKKSVAMPTTSEGERELRALAYQVLNGHIRNEYRSRRRRQALSDRLAGHRGRVSGGVSTEDVDDDAAARHWLGQLSEPDQEVILLFHAGFDLVESARILGCSVAATAKRRTRARHRLQAIVQRERGAQP